MRSLLITAIFFLAIFTGGITTAQNIKTDRFSCDVANSETATVLTARVNGIDEPVTLRIDWFSGKVTPVHFRNFEEKENRITSTHLIGITTITRTILASEEADCLLIHVIADQPGEVAFQARFQGNTPSQILDRRELLLPGGKIHAHAWIIPFESNVEDDGKSTISLIGEGEALIVLNLSKDIEKQPIANTWTRLAARYDPEALPPNPHLVWKALDKEAGSSQKK